MTELITTKKEIRKTEKVLDKEIKKQEREIKKKILEILKQIKDCIVKYAKVFGGLCKKLVKGIYNGIRKKIKEFKTHENKDKNVLILKLPKTKLKIQLSPEQFDSIKKTIRDSALSQLGINITKE